MSQRDGELVLAQLLRSYGGYFDVTRDVCFSGESFAALASFHSRGEKYVLTKQAKIWAVENNEHAYIALRERLDTASLEKLSSAVIEDGLSRIKPSTEHMYTYLTLVIIAREIEPEAKKALKALSFSKNFLFTLHGWTELRAVALELSTDEILHNKCGKQLPELFHNKNSL